MSRAVDAWSRAPRESAHVWASKGVTGYQRMAALLLLVTLDCAEGPVPGELDAAIARTMAGTMQPHERANFLRAVDRLKARGHLFEHEGQVYLLYSETMWRKYRSLGEQYAEKKPVLELVRTQASAAAPAAVGSQPARSRLGVQGGGHPKVNSGNHSTQGPREREREILRANTACSAVPPPPAAPPPATPGPVTETRPKPPEAKPGPAKAKRTRAPQPLDAPRERAVEVFNELWSPTRGHGAKWAPRGTDFGLLTAMVQSYLRTDGTLNEPLYRIAVRAFLNEGSWQHFGGWKPQKFLLHHLGGLTRTQATGTGGGYDFPNF